MLKTLSNTFVLLIFLTASTGWAANVTSSQLGRIGSDGLTREQAKQVLLMVLKQEGYKLNTPGMFIEELTDKSGKSSIPGYIKFGLGFDNPKVAATQYRGTYVVNVKSGDVWEIDLCNTFSFPQLKRIQHQVRTKTKITDTEERLQRRGLGCTD